jgi:hypothetical protein
MKPLAIIGLGPTHDDAPWEDETWERWGLIEDAYVPRCHFGFEIHDDPELVAKQTPRFREIGIPVYLNKSIMSVPMSLTYPLDEVKGVVGDYFGSTIAYMLALAIWQGRERTDLFGVDLSEDIYDHHRPNLEYLIGFARGRGMTVNVPPGSRLLSFDSSKFETHYPVRYGYTEAA